MGVGRLLRWCLLQAAGVNLNPGTALEVPGRPVAGGVGAPPGGCHDIYGCGEHAVLRG